MGELLKLDYGHYVNRVETKYDQWNKDKFVLTNNKKWDRKEYIKAYMNLLTSQIQK